MCTLRTAIRKPTKFPYRKLNNLFVEMMILTIKFLFLFFIFEMMILTVFFIIQTKMFRDWNQNKGASDKSPALFL
jgi:hypothetical protein